MSYEISFKYTNFANLLLKKSTTNSLQYITSGIIIPTHTSAYTLCITTKRTVAEWMKVPKCVASTHLFYRRGRFIIPNVP